MATSRRILTITAGLALTGAVVGALCAAVSVATILAFSEGVAHIGSGIADLLNRESAEILGEAAMIGAGLGVVAGPALAWGVLRYVPLGYAIAGTALGTVVGAVVGETLRPFNPYVVEVPGVLRGALVGFVLAGLVLRLVPAWRPRNRIDTPAA